MKYSRLRSIDLRNISLMYDSCFVFRDPKDCDDEYCESIRKKLEGGGRLLHNRDPETILIDLSYIGAIEYQLGSKWCSKSKLAVMKNPRDDDVKFWFMLNNKDASVKTLGEANASARAFQQGIYEYFKGRNQP